MSDLMLIVAIIKKYYSKFFVQIVFLFSLVVTSSIATLFIPYLTRYYYDRVLTGHSTRSLLFITLGILFCAIMLFVFKNFAWFRMSLIDIEVQKQIRIDATRNIHEMKLLSFYNKTPEYLYNRVLTDSVMVQESTVRTIMEMSNDILMFLIGSIMIASINPYLTIGILFLLFLSSFFSIRMGNILSVYQHRLVELLARYNATMQEGISSTFLAKIFGLYEFFTQRIVQSYSPFITIVKKARIKALLNTFFLNSIYSFSDFVVLLVGGYLVMQREITIGDLIAFIAIFKLISNPLNDTIINLMNFKKNVPLFKRINELLSLDKDSGIVEQTVHIQETIRLEHCKYYYRDEEEILRELSYTFYPHKIYVIHGNSGVGKSTLLYLLLGLFELQEGSIYYDDLKLSKENTYAFRQKIAFVEQEPSILNDTIYNNILIGNLSASEEEILHVAKQAYVDEFIDKMPDKYQSKIGADGQKLSTGQKQRLAIARALLMKPDVFLFDEPTSNIDPISVELIHKTIKDIRSQAFVIVISHQKDNDSLADVSLNLIGGKLIELKQ